MRYYLGMYVVMLYVHNVKYIDVKNLLLAINMQDKI